MKPQECCQLQNLEGKRMKILCEDISNEGRCISRVKRLFMLAKSSPSKAKHKQCEHCVWVFAHSRDIQQIVCGGNKEFKQIYDITIFFHCISRLIERNSYRRIFSYYLKSVLLLIVSLRTSAIHVFINSLT